MPGATAGVAVNRPGFADCARSHINPFGSAVECMHLEERAEVAMGGTIFVSYRRDDSPGTAGRLRDRLADAFGPDSLFMDVDNIPAGVDFVGHLNAQVAACDVFLAIVGLNWLNTIDETGCRRIDNPDDFVRTEIAAALARSIAVIPITINGARLPKADELPDPLKPLIRRQAVEVRNAQFHRDAEALIEKLHRALGNDRVGPYGQRAAVRFRWSSTRGRIMLAFAGALLLACWLGFYLMGVSVSDGVSKFDGNWLVHRVGCAARPELSFQIHLENGKISGRFEPREISALPGSRPPIIGSISASGEINFNHHKVDSAGAVADANAYYTGTFRGNSASGTFNNGECNGTFTMART
jgi:TIR domain